MARDNRSSANLARARADNRVQSAPYVHTWEIALPDYAEAKPKTRTISVALIARMMAEGEWRTGISCKMLARAWGTTPGTIGTISAEASRVVKCSIDTSTIMRTVSESIERLMENGYAAREDDNINGSTVAFTKAAELCLTLAKDSNPSDDRSQEDVHRALVAAGWTPPPTLLGLPAPSVMSPRANGTVKETSDDDDDSE